MTWTLTVVTPIMAGQSVTITLTYDPGYGNNFSLSGTTPAGCTFSGICCGGE